MPTRTSRAWEGRPLLDLASFGRRFHEAGGHLTREEVELIRRTVGRAPEAVVKVLPRGGGDLKAVGNHLAYISRDGEVELETDDGDPVRLTSQAALLKDWDLDLDDALRRRSAIAPTNGRVPKLAHKLMFSMPPGTPPEKVLGAVRNFAREEFWGQHRYVFALHTDEAHPHVHLVVKAISEQGVRLNIKKATLRHWRSEFARNLRAIGIEANATERAARGQHRKAKKDGIYRAGLRGESTYINTWAGGAATVQVGEGPSTEQGKRRLISTRRAVEGCWRSLADLLERGGHMDLARDVRRFVGGMATPRTDRELVRESPEYATYGISMRDKAYSR